MATITVDSVNRRAGRIVFVPEPAAAPDGVPNSREAHRALWLSSAGASMLLLDAPTHTPRADEVVVRARAIAVNPIDAMGGIARRVVLPWLTYPAVIGSDVAGEIVAVGSSVSGLNVGDRVVGYAVGIERSRNSAEGAFQTHVVLLARLVSRLPETIPFADACVLPMGVTTAAAGLFEHDQLALELPVACATPRHQSVLVFGGATSVGMNAIQLAHGAGYSVLATASRSNFELLERLGASVVVDYHDPDVVEQIIHHLSGQQLAGTIAVASGSLRQAIAVNASPTVVGTRRVASAHPTPVTRMRAVLARRQKIRVSAIWGGNPKDTPVGPAVWNDFLPDALASGTYSTSPSAVIVGHGLEAVPQALDRLRQGARAQKFVVTL
ncbi:zinc-binding alcohol dehydrogenase family protein [Subtercola frigoramans]|uniref:NADPH:quinone reductase-like Zn-dependent oxidoreductase n=1 Tax=Subtercola frigoramans TaxID=120298 RepID=A0ABS2L4B9_9MICO|nr:zinc-binding alcohol dehydrogenase family protein [Subtercola frigoramans]MBM7471301.1 NADPH:quinone reductase-like Zn-dependent oxidoreductase [Subtercola frigoramans]